MDIGPVQMIVYGFDQPRFGGGIAAELRRLREKDIVRIIDALVVYKDAKGEVETKQISDLSPEESREFGAMAGALVGLGAAGEAGAEAGAVLGAAGMDNRGGHVLDPEEWYVLDSIPNETAAAILLLEHRWAIPLRDSILAEGGIPLGDAWLHPRDMVEIGLLAAEEGARLEAQRSG